MLVYMATSKMTTTRRGLAIYVHDATYRTMDAHGFTLTCCAKCGGEGRLAGYEFSDNAKCWRCMGEGYYYRPATLRAKTQFIADLRDRKTVDIDTYWKAARSKVEPDVAAQIRAQVATYNAKISA